MDIRKTVTGLLIILLAGSGQAAQTSDPAGMSAGDISDCMRVNVFDRGAVRDFQIKATDREGRSRQVKFKVFWKPAKTDEQVRITLQVIEPESLKGTAYLFKRSAEEEQLHLYLPAIRQVTQLAGGRNTQKLWGSDLTFADVKQIQGLLADGDVKRLDDRQIAGRPVYLLETATDREQTGYRLVRSYVDQESCMLLKAEMFADGKSPQKVLEADIATLMEIDPWWVILGYRMQDNQAGTHTDIALSDIYIEERLPGSLFTPEGFYIDRK